MLIRNADRQYESSSLKAEKAVPRDMKRILNQAPNTGFVELTERGPIMVNNVDLILTKGCIGHDSVGFAAILIYDTAKRRQ
ncbi:hypothetical protein [Virgibacillus salinus]|uniref:hypothetical protein n=1 Tax=Virgibacillus salinus TaxID=553311 RepID=UPI000B87C5F0|nr:hypothetical protein [Virgibacillus salinus]